MPRLRRPRAAGCDRFIGMLENGYDTVVGGSGAHLSGGERRRIAIARAMLKDAPIIVLDEATAYVDPENEAVIQNALAKLVENNIRFGCPDATHEQVVAAAKAACCEDFIESLPD